MTIVRRTWNTRGYELDQDGQVSASNLLRYMEQLRWASMAQDSAVDLVQIFGGGVHFVVVAQTLAVQRDLAQAEPVWGALSLVRLGRSSLEFGHLFRAADEAGELVAYGRVTAVHIGRDGRPAPLPDAFRQRATPIVMPAWPEGVAREPLPLPGAAVPEHAFLQQLEVRPSDQDLLRHVNHARYLDYVEDCRLMALARGGPGTEHAAGRPRQVSLEYRAQALAGERLVVQGWVADPARRLVQSLVLRGGTLLCRAAVVLG